MAFWDKFFNDKAADARTVVKRDAAAALLAGARNGSEDTALMQAVRTGDVATVTQLLNGVEPPKAEQLQGGMALDAPMTVRRQPLQFNHKVMS